MTFLISHTNQKGSNVAQAIIEARNEDEAVAKFTEFYPERLVSTVGVQA